MYYIDDNTGISRFLGGLKQWRGSSLLQTGGIVGLIHKTIIIVEKNNLSFFIQQLYNYFLSEFAFGLISLQKVKLYCKQ